MAQRKKTPKHLVELIEQFHQYRDHMEERMRVKITVPEENQADHVRETSIDRSIGMVTGAWVMLEAALMAYGCYAGYMHVGPAVKQADGTIRREGHVPVGSDVYADWCRTYFVRT